MSIPLIRYRMSGQALTDAQLASWLADLPAPTDAVVLYLDDNALTDVSLAAIGGAPLDYMIGIRLNRNPITDEGAATIASTAIFQNIETLELASTQVGAAGVRQLLGEGSVVTGLYVLNLSDTAVGDEGLEAIAASPHVSWLNSLYLNRVGATDRGLAALAASKCFERLTYIELGGNDISAKAKAALEHSKGLANCTFAFDT